VIDQVVMCPLSQFDGNMKTAELNQGAALSAAVEIAGGGDQVSGASSAGITRAQVEPMGGSPGQPSRTSRACKPCSRKVAGLRVAINGEEVRAA